MLRVRRAANAQDLCHQLAGMSVKERHRRLMHAPAGLAHPPARWRRVGAAHETPSSATFSRTVATADSRM